MKTMSMRALLALGALLSPAAIACAEDWKLSDLGRQLMGPQQDQAPVLPIRAGDEELPLVEANPFVNDQADPAYEFCTDDPDSCCEGGKCCEGGNCRCDGKGGGCPGDGCDGGTCHDNCAPACCCGCSCGDPACGGECCEKPDLGKCFAEVQVMFLRPHLSEQAAGKLSEQYEFSPRFIWGYESQAGLGGRARYWTYGRTTPNLDLNEDPLRFEFDVLDVESTARFRTDRSELTVAGGLRWADIEIANEQNAVGTDMPGITFAADGRSVICRGCTWHWAGVCGARWSMLGGDWEGDDFALIEPTRDDNIVVQEIYGGVELLRCCRSCDFYARAVFEVQNWHSDALGDRRGSDSIGVVGPGVHAGVNY